jgi:AcrR family transcriptional regulator
VGRPRTISDETILAVSRDIFLTQGHQASTREIAQAAGVSEAILYQRYGTKEELFFAALAPTPPDLEEILGPEEPNEEPKTYVRVVVQRMTEYFSEVLPVALRLMMHPSFDHARLARSMGAPVRLQGGLAQRLALFTKQKRIRKSVEEVTARLLVTVAQDTALRAVMNGRAAAKKKQEQELDAIAEVVWTGIAVER